jgi:hypothetical protein
MTEPHRHIEFKRAKRPPGKGWIEINPETLREMAEKVKATEGLTTEELIQHTLKEFAKQGVDGPTISAYERKIRVVFGDSEHT